MGSRHIRYQNVPNSLASEIIRLCKQHDIRLYYINVPLYYGHRVSFPASADNTNYGTLLDYGDLFEGQAAYFADYVHLNPKGADAFSKVLKDALEDAPEEKTR